MVSGLRQKIAKEVTCEGYKEGTPISLGFDLLGTGLGIHFLSPLNSFSTEGQIVLCPSTDLHLGLFNFHHF